MTEIKVRVKLAADCLVDGVIREAGEIVELPQEVASDFGTIYSPKAEKASAKPNADNGN